MDRDKYRRLFIDEAKEGLALIQNELVAVEKAQTEQGGGDVEGLRPRFDAVFRSAHSLKGMGAAMGYTRFAALAHHLEDLADLGRQGRPLPPEAYDLLLEGTDVLESCVHKVEAGDDDPDAADLATRVAAFVLTLREATATTTPAATATTTPAATATTTTPTATTTTTPAATPPSPVAGDGDVSVLRVQIAPDASAPQVRAFVVLKALQGLPGFIDSAPSGEALRQGELPAFQKARLLEVRFARGENLDVAVDKAKACQGVKDVSVVKVEAKDKDDGKERDAAKDAAETRTVRVRTALLDDLIDSVGEVLLTRSRLRALSAKLELPELNDLVDEVDRLTRELHGRVVAARMTPLSLMTERLPRTVRDLARQQKKSVDFAMSGMDIELDRAILDELQAPLVHMVRNAVDHGHEGDDARAAAGKGPTMRLSLKATRDRDRVLLTLEDDGRGMNPQALRARAVDRGLIDKARAAVREPDGVLAAPDVRAFKDIADGAGV